MSESGYAIELEDRGYLASLPYQDVLFSLGYYQEIRLDPRKLIRVENQGSQGSCAGHSLSSTHLCAQQILDNLDTFAHMQTVCARQFRRRKATPDPPHRADTPRPSPAKP